MGSFGADQSTRQFTLTRAWTLTRKQRTDSSSLKVTHVHRSSQIIDLPLLQDVVMEAFLMAKGCHGLLSTCSGEVD